MIILFWISLVILFYCYAGYGILVFLWNNLRAIFISRKEKSDAKEKLGVTLIVTAYNEEAVLEHKIRNTLAIDYPADKLQVIFITDGSTDGSDRLIQKFPSIILMHQPVRKGKYAAVKRAMQQVQTPITVFSDANTLLNKECIERMVAHYSNAKTGGVAGEKRIVGSWESGVGSPSAAGGLPQAQRQSAVGQAERLYWQYESFMKNLDARFNTIAGAAGELFSIRTGLFKELDDELILDDFVISLQVCLQGYKIAYEPGAYATESPSVSLAEEEKRKVRISAGAYQSIGYLKSCLNVFKYPLLSFQYISRRLLRWVFCPVMLLIFLLSDILIVSNRPQNDLYTWILYAQILFYLFAFAGWLFIRSGKRAGLFTIPFYFVFMNYCLVKGFIKFMKGRHTVLWDKSRRQVSESVGQ